MIEREIQPGDLCRYVTDESGAVVAVEHVAPCADGHASGVMTEVRNPRRVLTALEAGRLR